MTQTRPETDAKARSPAPESPLHRRARPFTFTDWAAI